jgi:hypothetical protein
MQSRPFIYTLDTRLGSLFTQHVFKQNTQLQHAVPPFDEIKEFTKHYELRSDVDSHAPPENEDVPTMYESVFHRFGELKQTCMKLKLDIIREGRFFMIVNTPKCKLLQGYIFQQNNPFCTFFKGPSTPETVQCPDAEQAETYVKSFFTIEEEEEEEDP